MPAIMRALARSFRATRPGNWWFSKIPPLLAVAYLDILRLGTDPVLGALLLGCFLCSIAMVAGYGHVINDACDVETDLRAGKHNHMAGTSWTSRILLCASLLLAGFAPAAVVHYAPPTLLLLALNLLWPTVYSVPGVRLKERGIAGLACDALGSHVTPTLLAFSLFAMTSPAQPGLLFPVLMTAWAAVLGIKGILHHQIVDRTSDLSSGTVTFATRASPKRMSHFLTLFNLCAELPVSAALALATWRWAPLVPAALAIYCLLETIKYRLGFEFALTSEAWTRRRSVPFINESFYVLWLPLAAAIQLAASGLVWIWLPIVHVLLFWFNVAAQFAELKAVIQVADLPNRLVRRANKSVQ
jgi:hypothetical protein